MNLPTIVGISSAISRHKGTGQEDELAMRRFNRRWLIGGTIAVILLGVVLPLLLNHFGLLGKEAIW